MPGDLAWLNLSVRDKATSSAMMIPEYVAAALANAIFGNAMPSHLFNIPTAQGQEDDVSMAPNLGVRLHREIIPCLTNALAIELAYGAQASAIRLASETYPSRKGLGDKEMKKLGPQITALKAAVAKLIARKYPGVPFETKPILQFHCRWTEEERKLSLPCQTVVDTIHTVFPPVKKDRVMSEQLEQISELVQSGKLLDLAKQKLSISLNDSGLRRTREYETTPNLEKELGQVRELLTVRFPSLSSHSRTRSDYARGFH